MNILLTGGAGYVGSHTAVELLTSGYGVMIADNFSNSSAAVIRRIEKITGRSMMAYFVDLRDKGSLDGVFENFDIGCVIHFAGYKAVGESVGRPVAYYRNNLDCAITVLEAMEKYGVNHLIFSSSATVYGHPERMPITEDMPTGPCASPYGSTKLMLEKIITDAAAANSGLSAVLLRYFNPVGAHESGEIGEEPNGVPNNLMPFITQVAVGQRDKLRVFGNDYPTRDGTCVRDYVHVMDLARGHARAVEYCRGRSGVEAINLGTGTGNSVLDVIGAFERASGVKLPYEIAARRDGDIPECYADVSKAKRLMDWQARLTLEDMCRDAWNWQQKNPDGYGK